MINLIPINIFRFIVVVFLQVMLFSQLNIHPYINIYVYPMFILLLPFETPRWLQMLLGLLIGVAVDVYLGTLGMHASAGLMIGYFRQPILSLITPRGTEYEVTPNIFLQGISWFSLYTVIVVGIDLLWYFIIENWTFLNIGWLILKFIVSTFFSTVFILIILLLTTSSRKRRLG
jgi:hypothetical protein